MSATDPPVRLAILVVVGPAEDASATRLLTSLARFNRDGLPVHVRTAVDGGLDRDAVTLGFASLGLAENYLVLPADSVVVRSFGVEDFVDADGAPAVYLTEDRERRVTGIAADDEAAMAVIRQRLHLTESRRLISGVPTLLESKEVSALLSEQSPDGTALALLRIASDAGAWYASWLLASRGPSLRWREPVFLQLGHHGVPSDFSLGEATESDLARGFLGYVGDLPSTGQQDPLGTVPPKELVKAASMRLYGKAPRIQRLVRRVAGG